MEKKNLSLNVHLMIKEGATPDSFACQRFVYPLEGATVKFWFCFLNCSVQKIFVHCNLFTSASVRPCPCLCLQLFFFSFQSLKSTVHLLASSVKCWEVFSIYSCAWITWVKILQINYICGFQCRLDGILLYGNNGSHLFWNKLLVIVSLQGEHLSQTSFCFCLDYISDLTTSVFRELENC